MPYRVIQWATGNIGQRALYELGMTGIPIVIVSNADGTVADLLARMTLEDKAALMRLLCSVLTVQGFTVSAAIAGTSVCARTMNRHVHGRIIRDGEEADLAAQMPRTISSRRMTIARMIATGPVTANSQPMKPFEA